MGVGFLGVFGVLANKNKFAAILCVFVALYSVISLATNLQTSFAPADYILRFGLCYLVGAAGFLYRERLPLNFPILAVLCVITFAARATEAYQLTLILTLGYGTIWAAYVPAGKIRAFNNWGDISYGIYIYGFTVKQMVFSTLPDIEPPTLFLIASPFTILLAAASFYFVEKPALGWRFKFATSLEKAFSKSG